MKTLAFAIRNAKEMLRDKLNLVFGIGFPVIVLLLLSLIQSNIYLKSSSWRLESRYLVYLLFPSFLEC